MPTRKRGKLYTVLSNKKGLQLFREMLKFRFRTDFIFPVYLGHFKLLFTCKDSFSNVFLVKYCCCTLILYASNPIPPAPSKSRRVGCMILVYQANCSPFFYWFKFSLCVCVPMQKRQTKKAKLFSLVFAARPMSYSNWRVVSLREVGNRLTWSRRTHINWWWSYSMMVIES